MGGGGLLQRLLDRFNPKSTFISPLHGWTTHRFLHIYNTLPLSTHTGGVPTHPWKQCGPPEAPPVFKSCSSSCLRGIEKKKQAEVNSTANNGPPHHPGLARPGGGLQPHDKPCHGLCTPCDPRAGLPQPGQMAGQSSSWCRQGTTPGPLAPPAKARRPCVVRAPGQ